MTAMPAGAKCAQHVEVEATGVCNRCGGFFCEACAQRVRPDSTPMCPACWALRSVKVKDQPINKHGLQNAALAMGLISLIPAPEMIVVQLISVILAIVAMVKSDHKVAWRPVVGLLGAAAGFVMTLAIAAK